MPTTLLDLSQCAPGQPRVYSSNAHFLYAPIQLLESIDGMEKPDPIKDETSIDIEPLTGVVIQAKERTQLNVGVLRGNLK